MCGCQKVTEQQDSLLAGKAIYEQHCVACHGPGGNVRQAEQHSPETPDLRAITERSAAGRFPRVMLAEVIDGRRILDAHGTRTMPVWGEQLGAADNASVKADINALTDYLESIQQ